MRLKIIAVFSLIVLLLGGLFVAISFYTTASPLDTQAAPRALQAAVTELDVEGMATERWLITQAKDASVREPFGISDKLGDARARKATEVCDALRAKAQKAPELHDGAADFIALVDTKGVVLGRDQLTAMRNEDLGKAYPSLKAALDAKASMSDVWLDKSLNHQHLVSFAPIFGDDGKLAGGVVYASLLNDARLSAMSAGTSAQPLLLVSKTGNGVEVIAKSDQADAATKATLEKAPAAGAIAKGSGDAMDVPGFGANAAAKARGLEGYGDDGSKVALVAVVTSPPAAIGKVILPILGLTALGLLLVVLAGYMLDAYIMRPIAELEEGLPPGIINGQTNRRFEIEHAELGGVVFRLNLALEPALRRHRRRHRRARATVDRAERQGLQRSLIDVDESMAESSTATVDAAALRAEPEDAYYERLFSEYIAAKRNVRRPHRSHHPARVHRPHQIERRGHGPEARQGRPVQGRVERQQSHAHRDSPRMTVAKRPSPSSTGAAGASVSRLPRCRRGDDRRGSAAGAQRGQPRDGARPRPLRRRRRAGRPSRGRRRVAHGDRASSPTSSKRPSATTRPGRRTSTRR